MRADAERNRTRLVAVASEVVAEQGAGASLEEIARRAGVGSATLHRHFPSRPALLDAVFADRVAELCAKADLTAPDPGDALVRWLAELVHHATTNRGLGTSLLKGTGESCHARILAVGEELTNRAVAANAIGGEVTTKDLLALANGIALATEDDPPMADRLLALVVTGLRTVG
jgi:AcrR family transcriptional regulator